MTIALVRAYASRREPRTAPITHTATRTTTGPRRPRAHPVLALTLGMTVVEIAGGLWTGSLALLADAGHMFSDTFAIGLALAAVTLAPSRRRRAGASASSARRSSPRSSTA